MTFNVGDRVRVVGVPEGDELLLDCDDVRIGDFGTVEGVEPWGLPFRVTIDRTTDCWYFEEKNLEPEVKPFTVYLAGPMRGYEHCNFPAFDHAAEAIRNTYGWSVISPAEEDRKLGFDETAPDALEGFDMVDAIRRDVDYVIAADAIVLLPGWEKSTGTAAELAVARFLSKDILYWIDGEVWRGTNGPDHVRVVPMSPSPAPERPVATDTPSLWSHAPQASIPDAVPVFDEDGCLVIMAHPLAVGEERVVDPATGGAKGRKLARMDLLPWDALVALSEHYGKGAGKYEDRNWERGYAWSLSFAAAQRHAAAWWQGEDIDAEGYEHLCAWAWHSINLLAMSKRAIGTDDRPKTALAS